MCEVCEKNPCAAFCPNAPMPEVVERCDICRGPIRENEDYMYGNGEAICMDCVFEMSPREVFEYFGYERRTAEICDLSALSDFDDI